MDDFSAYASFGSFDWKDLGIDSVPYRSATGHIALYNSEHELTWQAYVGGSKQDAFLDGIATSDGSFVGVGSTQSNDGSFAGKKSDNVQDGFIYRCTPYDGNGHSVYEELSVLGSGSKTNLDAVVESFDADGNSDGYIAVGATMDNSGKIAELTGKTSATREGLIVKFDKSLNIEWASTFLNENSKTDEFFDVLLTTDGDIVVAGWSYMGGTGAKYKDANAVRFGVKNESATDPETGAVTQNTVLDQLAINSFEGVSSDKEDAFTGIAFDSETPDADSGFVLVGRTKSDDFGASGVTVSEKESAVFVRVDKNLQLVEKESKPAVHVYSDGSASAARAVVPYEDGFVLSGYYSAASGDFAGAQNHGDTDAFVANVDEFGELRKITSVGGSGKDRAVSLMHDRTSGEFVISGHYMSPARSFSGAELLGPVDGFLLGLSDGSLRPTPSATSLLDVDAYSANSPSTLSMADPALYAQAYAEKVNDGYQVTVYWTNAKISGTSFLARTLQGASYDQAGDGTMVNALRTNYDESIQVRSYTMVLSEDRLKSSDGIKFHVNGMMTDEGQDLVLKFDSDSMEPGEAPSFPEITVDVDNVSAEKTVVGGSSYDMPSAMALSEDNLYVVGKTRSRDHDFKNCNSDADKNVAFVNVYDSDKTLQTAMTFEAGTRSDANDVAAAGDGGVFVAGYYSEEEGHAPSGAFASTIDANNFGGWNAYVMKIAENNTVSWINGASNTGSLQFKSVAATDDGGCIAVGDCTRSAGSFEGDYTDEMAGIVSSIVVKFKADGSEEWHKVLNGGPNNILSADNIEKVGNAYVISGRNTAGAVADGNALAGCAYYGGTLDIFSTCIDANGNTLWSQTYGGNDGSAQEGAGRIFATRDGGYAMVGHTKSADGSFAGVGTGAHNAFVMKCDASGTTQWVDVIPSTEYSAAVSVAEDKDGNLIVVGETDGTDGAFKGMAKGDDDAFVAWYTPDGKRVNVQTVGGSNVDSATDVCTVGGSSIVVLMDSNSVDGDLAGLNRGDVDGLLLSMSLEPQGGQKAELADKTELNAAIASADAARKDVAISMDGSDVPSSKTWVTKESAQTFEEAIQSAQTIADKQDATAAEIADAKKALDDALAAFKPAAGTMKDQSVDPAPSETPVPNVAPDNKSIMYRLYNPNSGEHFYTASAGEIASVAAAGWRFEDEAWKAPETSNTPVFRLYNPNAGDHHYTPDVAERDELVAVGWVFEGTGWYSDDAKGTPLYRLYNPNAVTGTHHYTVDAAERDYLVSQGWRAEGVGWYGLA